MSSSSRSRMFGRMSGLGVSILILLVGFLPMAPLSQSADAAVLPTISVDDVTVTEGTGGTVSAVFHLSQDKRGKTTVRFATSEGTAKAPGDFISKTGRIRFAGNKLTKTVAITVVGDTIDEANENFFLDLSQAVGATIADDRGEATITDNDASPTVSVMPSITVPEGNAGDHPSASVDVTLSTASGRPVSSTSPRLK